MLVASGVGLVSFREDWGSQRNEIYESLVFLSYDLRANRTARYS